MVLSFLSKFLNVLNIFCSYCYSNELHLIYIFVCVVLIFQFVQYRKKSVIIDKNIFTVTTKRTFIVQSQQFVFRFQPVDCIVDNNTFLFWKQVLSSLLLIFTRQLWNFFKLILWLRL